VTFEWTARVEVANRRCRLLDGLVMATVRVLRSIVDLWACAGWGLLHRHPVVMGDRGKAAYRRTGVPGKYGRVALGVAGT